MQKSDVKGVSKRSKQFKNILKKIPAEKLLTAIDRITHLLFHYSMFIMIDGESWDT